MYATFNRFEIQLTKVQAEIGCHQGQCDQDIEYLMTLPKIRRQLAKLNPHKLRDELREYGAWDAEQLANHDDNLQRVLWLACGDIVDGI